MFQHSSLYDCGCLYWLTEWLNCTWVMHTHRLTPAVTEDAHSAPAHRRHWHRPPPPTPRQCMTTLLSLAPFSSVPIPVPACSGGTLPARVHSPACVTALRDVFMLSPWCVLLGSRGSNTRWLLILGCSICYAGAPPSLVFHVECHCIRHVS